MNEANKHPTAACRMSEGQYLEFISGLDDFDLRQIGLTHYRMVVHLRRELEHIEMMNRVALDEMNQRALKRKKDTDQ